MQFAEIENLNYLKITNFKKKDLSFYAEMFSAVSSNNSIRTLIFDVDIEISEDDWKIFVENYLLHSDLTELVIINPHSSKIIIENLLRQSKYINLKFENN